MFVSYAHLICSKENVTETMKSLFYVKYLFKSFPLQILLYFYFECFSVWLTQNELNTLYVVIETQIWVVWSCGACKIQNNTFYCIQNRFCHDECKNLLS